MSHSEDGRSPGQDEFPWFSSLPADLTSFEGRRNELADVKRMLGDSRLVTLTGIGGVGKTRIALRLARELRRQFPDGVGWVELADLRDAALLAQTVEDQLSIPEKIGRDPLWVLIHHLRRRRMLLVLDNCEHLREPCAQLVDQLLRAAPELRLLVTSRQALGVHGESPLAIPPLPVPAAGVPLELGAAASCASMALFANRASTISPEFKVTADNQEDLAELCRKLAGVPLAIELAAVKVRVLSIGEIVARLDTRLELLRGTGHGGRHQSIQATIDWSYDLCTPDERLLWARASVFVGGFHLEAAESVCSDSSLPHGSILDATSGLIDKSILGRTEVDGHVRFRLLEPLREHGHAELCRRGEEDVLRDRHLAWCAEFVSQACMQWFGPAQERWCVVLRLDHANIRAAAEYALSQPHRVEEALTLLGDPWFLWVALFLDEGRHWLDRALAASSTPSRARAKALATAGYVAALQGDGVSADIFVEESHALASKLGDAGVVAYATHVRGLSALFNDPDRAVSLLREALPLYEATEMYDDFVVVLRVQLGLALLFHGDADGAEDQFALCRQLCTVTGEHWLLSYALYGLGFISKLRGNLKEAEGLVLESVRIKRFFEDSLGLAVALDLLAWIKAEAGEAGEAALVLGAASRVWDSFGVRLFGSEHWLAQRERAVEQSRGRLGARAYAAAFSTGETLPRDRALAHVLGESTGRPHETEQSVTVLTMREQQIAELVADGLTNRAISERLVIAQRTAEGHVENILTKFGFHSRTQIAAWVSQRRTAATPP
jgi:predicted ATPase/DNA-binding CsgD family transcriptional regulator